MLRLLQQEKLRVLVELVVGGSQLVQEYFMLLGKFSIMPKLLKIQVLNLELKERLLLFKVLVTWVIGLLNFLLSKEQNQSVSLSLMAVFMMKTASTQKNLMNTKIKTKESHNIQEVNISKTNKPSIKKLIFSFQQHLRRPSINKMLTNSMPN